MRLLAIAALFACYAPAQSNPALSGILREHESLKTKILAAAQKAPEEIYGFKPTPEVFALRRTLLHLAGGQMSICASFAGDPAKAPKVDDQAPASKQEVLAALNRSYEFCDAVFKAASDSTLAETVASRNRQIPKSYHAAHMIGHAALHYGNIVTYLRLKGLSPGD